MKRTLSILLLLVVATLQGMAQEPEIFELDGIKYMTPYNSSAAYVMEILSTDETVVIPATVMKDFVRTVMGVQELPANPNVKAVVLDWDDATKRAIEDYAFWNLSNLEALGVNSSVPPTLGTNIFSAGVEYVIVKGNQLDTYLADEAWNDEFYMVLHDSNEVAGGNYKYKYALLTRLAWGVEITTSATNVEGDYSVPGTLDGLPVISIANEAFMDKTNILKLTLPSTLKHIGNYAFSGCYSIVQVTFLGQTPPYLGSNVFNGCSMINDIRVPYTSLELYKGVDELKTYNIYKKDFGTFEYDGLQYTIVDEAKKIAYAGKSSGPYEEEIAIPSSVWNESKEYFVEGIADSGFKDMGGHTYVLPAGLKYIGGDAFKNCDIISINIPANVEYIEENAFYHAEIDDLHLQGPILGMHNDAWFQAKAANLHLDGATPIVDWVKTIETCGIIRPAVGQFWCNGSLLTTLDLTGISSIPDYVFLGFGDVVEIVFPAEVEYTSIGERAFWSCSSLQSVEIPEGITTLGYAAFDECTALVQVTIPSTVTEIEGDCFDECSSLSVIEMHTLVPPTSIDMMAALNIETAEPTIVIPAGVSEDYMWDAKWNPVVAKLTPLDKFQTLDYSFIKDHVTFKITKNTNPDYEVKIVNGSGYVGDVNIPIQVHAGAHDYTITAIGNFYSNPNVTSVSLPSSIVTIDEGAFSDMGDLQSVDLTSCTGLKSIEDNTFTNCSSLQRVYFPSQLTSIGNGAFCDDTNLEMLDLESTKVSNIGKNAFRGCSALKTIALSPLTKSIGQGAFSLCGNLQTVSFEGAEEMQFNTDAFDGCDNIETVKIASTYDWLTSLFANASANPLHGGNASLFITFDNEVLTAVKSKYAIAPYAFYGYKKLKEAALFAGPSGARVCDYAFAGATGLTKASIDGDIEKHAFDGCTSLEEVTVGENCTKILSEAFKNCTSLKSITVPELVGKIEGSAFANSGLESMNMLRQTPYAVLGTGAFTGAPFQVIYVPDGAEDDYKTSWVEYAEYIHALPAVGYKATADATYYTPIDVSSGTLTITDGSYYEFFVGKETNLTSLTYTRNFTNKDCWQPWLMPFDMTITAELLQHFKFAKFAGTYSFYDEDAGKDMFFISVYPLSVGDVLKANVPYMVNAKATGAYTFTVNSAKLVPTEEGHYAMQTAELDINFHGIYETYTCTAENHGWYGFSGKGQYIQPNPGAAMKPFRFYFTMTPRNDNWYDVKLPEEVKIWVLGEDNETGVEEIPLSTVNDPQSTDTYNLSGQKVGNGYKGVVVKEGRKVLR